MSTVMSGTDRNSIAVPSSKSISNKAKYSSVDFKDRTILVVDDIFDEGHTLAAICEYLEDYVLEYTEYGFFKIRSTPTAAAK